MATIDIGKLTFTHKGDYAGGTAYVANDVVYYNGSAYIAKTSTTGNLPTSTAHWNTFSAGSGGIWNSGLSLGTANQVVRVNSGASALEFGDLSSDVVKIDSGSFSSVSYIDLDGTSKWGTSGTYARHKVVIYNLAPTESTDIYARQIASGSLESGTHYSWVVAQRNSGNTSVGCTAGDNVNTMKFTHDQIRGANHGACSHSLEFEIGGMQKVGSGSNNNQLQMLYRSTGSNQDGTKRQIMHLSGAITVSDDGINAARTGIRFYWNNGNATGNYAIYGFKV